MKVYVTLEFNVHEATDAVLVAAETLKLARDAVRESYGSPSSYGSIDVRGLAPNDVKVWAMETKPD